MIQPTPEPGRIIDGFRLVERIYAGRLSTLWRVSHPAHIMSLVMKLPRLDPGADPAAVVGFEVEQMILPTLSGPHVPRFVAGADFAATAYIVSEFIGGGTLADRLSRQPRPAAEVAALGARLARAVHSLHEQQVIHLDLKPQNVLFRDDGEAVLIDYGLARHGDLPDLLAESLHLPLGTGASISPEQVLRIRDDPRSDIFSLGVILYVLATGRTPFGSPATEGGVRRRLFEDPLPPRRINPECPPWLQEIILGCLETDPADRFGTAAEVGLLLANPDQVRLTARAHRRRGATPWSMARKWLRALRKPGARPASPRDHLARNPIIVVALEMRSDPALLDAMHRQVTRLLAALPEARLACLAVRRSAAPPSAFAPERHRVDLGGQVKTLVRLKHWARDLGPEGRRVTFHVLESADPAATIVGYVRANRADHLLIGAKAQTPANLVTDRMAWGGMPTASEMARLGPVAVRVVAESPCTVTLVRA